MVYKGKEKKRSPNPGSSPTTAGPPFFFPLPLAAQLSLPRGPVGPLLSPPFSSARSADGPWCSAQRAPSSLPSWPAQLGPEAQRTPPLSPLSPQRTPTPTLTRPLADKPGPLHSLPARLPAGPRASVAPSRARESVVRVPHIPLTRRPHPSGRRLPHAAQPPAGNLAVIPRPGAHA